ncbi:12858_t:CDS:2, partial [Racocetra fulgida]
RYATTNMRSKQKGRNMDAPDLFDEEPAFKRQEVRRSQMSLDTLRTIAEQLNLETSGNKTDLVKRITLNCTRNMPQQSVPSSSTVNVYQEDVDNDTLATEYFRSDNQQQRGNSFTESSSDQSDVETITRKKQKTKPSEMVAFLTELKKLRKDMNNMNMRVEETRTKSKIDDEWPEQNFEKQRDQHEYDTIRAIGKELDLALNALSVDEALEYIESAKKRVKDRLTTLRVVKKYGWDVAVELPLSKDDDFVEQREAIEKAQQIAATKRKGKIDIKSPQDQSIIKEHSAMNRTQGITGRTLTAITAAVSDTWHLTALQQKTKGHLTNKQNQIIQETTVNYTRAIEINVIGRLNHPSSVAYWENKIKASPLIIGWLTNGFPLFPRGLLPLAALPEQRQYTMNHEQTEWI